MNHDNFPFQFYHLQEMPVFVCLYFCFACGIFCLAKFAAVAIPKLCDEIFFFFFFCLLFLILCSSDSEFMCFCHATVETNSSSHCISLLFFLLQLTITYSTLFIICIMSHNNTKTLAGIVVVIVGILLCCA